jgi:hypothetical protein
MSILGPPLIEYYRPSERLSLWTCDFWEFKDTTFPLSAPEEGLMLLLEKPSSLISKTRKK